MNMFEFAMQMELDGKAFYLKHAGEQKNADLRQVLTMLAEEEQKHYNIFKKLNEGAGPSALTTGQSHSATLTKAKNIFVELSNNTKHPSFTDNEKSIWLEALKLEEKSEKFYREKAEEEPDPARKNLLNLIANEERNHIYMIDSVLTYMKFPDTFSDTAKFKNFKSLEGH
ncbi:MAG: ferritin family protein [Candidatus Zixiibacteriota bacterium]